jgi:parallel beta-helix repeat protein
MNAQNHEHLRQIAFSLFLWILFLSSSGLHAQSSASYFVANNGNDANPGSLQQPLQTIDAAIKVIKRSTFQDITIFLRGGVYPIAKSVGIIESKNDTVKNITISNYKNEIVQLIGGLTLDNSQFSKVKDKAILDRLPAVARQEVYVTNLSKQGISDFGKMKKNGIKSPQLPAGLELFYNNAPMQLARWPNDSLLAIGKVFQMLKTPTSDPAFSYDYDRPSFWAASSDKWIGGQFAVGYAYDNVPVDSFGLQTKILYLKEMPSYGIYSSTDVSEGQIRQARKIRGYYFYNILEELDRPGEWYRSDSLLYLWPTSPIKEAVIQVSMLEQPILALYNCAHITIHNINFSCSRGNAIQIDKSNNVTIENCTFSDLGMQGIVALTTTNFRVINCKIAHTGSGGILVNGGDRKALSPSNNIIKNCEFSDYSRLYKTYTPAVNLDGVGSSILNCYIHDAPDQAITFSGNNHILAYNHIRKVCTWFSDMGAIYTGRDPSSTGTFIINNFFDSIQNNVGVISAVYVDDGSGGMTVDQNLFYASGSGGHGAVHVNGGADNKFENNIFVDCSEAFSNQPWNDEQWKNQYLRNPAYVKKLTKTVDIRSDIYINQYPYLKGFFDSTSLRPRNNFINNTIFFRVKISYAGNSYQVTNSFSTETDPGFANYGKGDFNLITIPNDVRKWTNWKPIEFNKVGVH